MELATLQKQYEQVPIELKQLKRWVCYNVEGLENGKTTKRPYNAMNGKLARVNDKLTWTTFNLALNGCIKYNFKGLGFILGDGIFGIDLDNHADENGKEPMSIEEFNNLSNEFVSSLNSYSEYSQSGKGVHIICAGKLPEGARRKGFVEMYDQGRFFAFTGNVINNVPIRNCEKEVVPLWGKYVNVSNCNVEERKPTFIKPIGAKVLTLSDEEVIESALSSRNGEDFYRYYNEGDLSRNGGDASSADMSFCNMLAFWTNKNAVQMDRIFRNSALYRAKWDEKRGYKTYGEITIDTAISMVSTGYEKISKEKNYNIKNVEKETSPNLSDLTKPNEFLAEMNIDANGDPIFKLKKIYGAYPYTDTGNAMRFYDYFGEYFKYNVTDKIFMFWTGKTWIRDKTNIIRKYANKFIEILKEEEKSLQEQIETFTKVGDTIKAKQLQAILDASIKNTTRVSNKAGKDAMLSELQCLKDIPVESSEFDKNDYLLNTDSGVVDLKTGKTMDFNKTYMCSKNTNCNVSYEPPETWLKFLHGVFKQQNEEDTQELIDALQLCLGYSLSGSTREQVMFLLWGSGSNGKSTMVEEIAAMLGDYGDNIQSDVLMQKKTANNSTFSIAKLQTTRYVYTGETDEGGKIAEAQIKILTGGDSISAQFKYGQEFSFKPKFKIWMMTNNKPIIRGTDYGIWRRVFMFPFINRFSDEEKDIHLPDKLKAERAKILGWCIKGFLKYQEIGKLPMPRVIRTTVQEYKHEMDVISQFISNECKVGESYHIDAKTLYDQYKAWAEDNTEYKMKESKFSEELQLKGFKKERNGVGKFEYIGIAQIGVTIGMTRK